LLKTKAESLKDMFSITLEESQSLNLVRSSTFLLDCGELFQATADLYLKDSLPTPEISLVNLSFKLCLMSRGLELLSIVAATCFGSSGSKLCVLNKAAIFTVYALTAKLQKNLLIHRYILKHYLASQN